MFLEKKTTWSINSDGDYMCQNMLFFNGWSFPFPYTLCHVKLKLSSRFSFTVQVLWHPALGAMHCTWLNCQLDSKPTRCCVRRKLYRQLALVSYRTLLPRRRRRPMCTAVAQGRRRGLACVRVCMYIESSKAFARNLTVDFHMTTCQKLRSQA